jgi:STE24 endopeptidase
MSRVLLLILFILWMAWKQDIPLNADSWRPAEVGVYLAWYGVLVGVMRLWSRWVSRQIHRGNISRHLRRFTRAMFFSRVGVVVWLGWGLFGLGWGDFVLDVMGPAGRWSIQTPAALVGVLPALLAWAGLWWSQYPADRALREQSLLSALENGLPVYSPPGLRSYLKANLRLQMLFTVVPVVMLLAAHDLLMVAVLEPLRITPQERPWLNFGLLLVASGGIFVIAPEILRWVLHTQPLADSPLRRRMEELCRRHKMRYRDILLWRTDHNMGNAAVMGVIPRFRYVLLSDLVLQTMTDEQIEAVFAHELGHVVHRHMLWYLLFVLIFMFALIGPGQWVESHLSFHWLGHWVSRDVAQKLVELVLLVGAGATFLLSFGYVSRRFERQADVFAARTMQGEAMAPMDRDSRSHVGAHGARIFQSALHRVAVINNIPVAARSWCHGSIASRMDYLENLSQNPQRTWAFDRLMSRLYLAMILGLIFSLAWVVKADSLQQPGPGTTTGQEYSW